MKLIKNTLDNESWYFISDRDYEEATNKLVTRSIEAAISKAATSAHLPVMWGPEDDGIGGKCPDDPLAIYFSMHLTGDNGDDNPSPVYRESIKDLVMDVVDGHRLFVSNKVPHTSIVVSSLLKALEELVKDVRNSIDWESDE